MPSTFLGKWRIYCPTNKYAPNKSDGYASYEYSGEHLPYQTFFKERYINLPDSGPYPPGKSTNIAFIRRADGQLCFLLNNGQYVGQTIDYLIWVSTLDNAMGFAFPGYNPQSLPTPFTVGIQTTEYGFFIGIYPWTYGGDFQAGSPLDDSNTFTMTQVTPTLPSIQASRNGDGLDFAWVDLTGVALDGVSLVKADFSNCNLNHAKLTHCDLTNAMLTNCHLTGTDFSGSVLDGASLTGDDLTSVIAAPLPQFHITPLTAPSLTNPRTTLAGCRLNQSLLANDWSMLDLTGATILGLSSPLSSQAKPLQVKYSILKNLNGNNLSGLSLQSAVFDYSVLDGLGFSHSDLTNASLIDVSMHGTNLTGATLKGANMTGAQLGSKGLLFTLPPSSQADLKPGNVDAALVSQFAQNGITLSPTATLSNTTPGVAWQLNDAGNNHTYTIRLETNSTNNSQTLVVYSNTTGAILSYAYMPNATLTGANLYGASADHIQFYGSNAKIDGSAILEEAQLNDSNLSNLNLTQAQLLGTNLSGSYLFNAKFNKARLIPSANGVAASLSAANLQGADFTDAQLYGANLANAAVAISTPTTANPNQGGVYLFSLPYSGDTRTAQQYMAELNAASAKFSLNPQGDAPTLQKYVTALETNNLNVLKIPFLEQHPSIHLSANAQIKTITGGSVWQIVDGTESYTLWTDIDQSGNTELYAAPSLTNMQAAFHQNGITLRWQASAAIDKAGQQWLIDNDSQNPQNFSLGYVRFILKLDNSVLDVYGTAVRIERLGDKNQLQIDTETCNVTKLTVTNMNAQTICPNGAKLSTNQSRGGVTWDVKWLRASTPPAPPTCVPTDNSWCPQVQARTEKK
jgi:uncharacterized protein YjbI with pentapeptide repeats